MKSLKDKARCYLDIETSGLEAGVQEILSLAIIKVEPNGERSVYQTKVRPVRIHKGDDFALRMNKYTDEAWASAPYFKDIYGEVVKRLRGSVVIGHNVQFDLSFIDAELKIIGAKGFSRNVVDTMTIAYEHLTDLGLEGLSLDKIRDFLGWDNTEAHTALFDAQTCERLYSLLAKASWLTYLKIKTCRKFKKEVR
jgi:DNA polymerase III epsilon subunit-like protein